MAISTLLAAAVWLPLGHAQAQSGLARNPVEDRNLQVQAVAKPAAGQLANNAQRLALVIGNSAYKDAPLANPVNDARAIALALKESGFSVIVRENIDQRGMLAALREFGDRLRAGGTGLFYYAGHGMQIKGRNYLIPVGANIDREDEVAYSAVDAQAVLDKMEAAGNVANIMILDACRNNPFTRSMRSGQAGLAQMDAPVGTLVAYATSPGAVASDGTGANGLYTQHLLTAIRQPSSKVEDVFKQVRANVRRDSQGKQVPWESTSLEGDFYFTGGPVILVVAPTVVLAPSQSALDAGVESALWDAVKGSSLPIEIRAYLNRYPSGRFAADANARLAQLQPGVAPTLEKAPIPLPAPAMAAPARIAPPRPAPVTTSAGFTLGDKYRYQVTDKFRGEVVRNYAQSIDKQLGNGTLAINGGSQRWDARGNPRYTKSTDQERIFSAAYVYVPPILQAGAKTPLDYEVEHKFTDGRLLTEVNRGTMVVKGQEKVRTPAGEFNAWRVEIKVDGQLRGKAGSYFWHFTGWYVPELRAYVAFDDWSRNSNGTTNRNDHHELTSFSVRGAENLAQR